MGYIYIVIFLDRILLSLDMQAPQKEWDGGQWPVPETVCFKFMKKGL
jgi:hypothetical protein